MVAHEVLKKDKYKMLKNIQRDYNKSICVEDFSGFSDIFGANTNLWADYYPDLLATYFGGCWQDVPPLHTEKQPTNKQANQWANYHIAMM